LDRPPRSLWNSGGFSFHNLENHTMLRYSIIFLMVALIAGVFGFTTVAGTAATAAQLLFFVFLVMFIVTLVVGRSKPSNLV
jgi:uncharacterized membrane protein YtjA (UPF0391 family)